MTAAVTVLTSDIVCGYRPKYIAETSFSAAARVRRPKLVQR
jgi:hypothetical protein